MHDRVAELKGYRDELTQAQSYGRTGIIGRIQREIDRVSEEIEARAVVLDAQASDAAEAGQDALALQHRQRAADLRSNLDAPGEKASYSGPLERAVPQRKGNR